MPFCCFAESYPMMGVTPVENLFIQSFLPQAPGDYVRVYLYGLMQCYYPVADMTLEKMAQALGLEPETVRAAYTYWERRGLVERLQDKPPAYRYIHPVSSMMNESDRLDEQIYRYQDLNAKLQQMIPDRPFSASDSDIVCQWIEDLGLPEEVVLIFVRHCIDLYMNRERGRRPENLKNFRLKNYDKEAMAWVSDGIVTVEKAQERVERDKAYYKLAQKVLTQLGISFRQPTRDELDAARKWLEEYHMDQDAVLAACRETLKSRNPNFAYLDTILQHNREAGSREQMQRQLDEKRALSEGVKQLHQALGIVARTPTPEEIARYQKYLAGGFTPEGVLLVATELGAHGQYDMEQLERAMTGFAARGQFTLEEMQAYLSRQKELRAQVAVYLEKSGQDRRPTNADVAQLEGWLKNAPFEVVEYAAECAHGTQLPTKYMDKLLSQWAKEDIHTLDVAKSRHPMHRPNAQPQAPANAAQNYDQRKYDNEKLNYLFEDDEEDAR